MCYVSFDHNALNHSLISQNIMISTSDLDQMKALGISQEDIEKQRQFFVNGFPPLPIIGNVADGDGVRKISEDEIPELIESWDKACENLDVQKFVPASGAASRMFKALYAFVNADSPALDDHPAAKEFVEKITDFAFYEDLIQALDKAGYDFEKLMAGEAYQLIVAYVLNEEGLNYGFLPKGLLKFHNYDAGSRTAAEEHLAEAAEYAVSKGKDIYIHFTVSPQHKELFASHLEDARKPFEERYGVTYHITFSEQDPSTNTMAVDFENEPFRLDDGSILFRPAGHGALLKNLNALDSDVVLIKNIDNIVPDRIKDATFTYKKLLGALLVRYQTKTFEYLRKLDDVDLVTDNLISEIEDFLAHSVFYRLSPEYAGLSLKDKIATLHGVLNRPIRVCGMVVNTGATGGGPFWVENGDGSASLQIVETAQMDMEDPKIKSLLSGANYFNPVDLVCGLKDYKGNAFDLMHYRDDNTGIITEKSMGGRNLKALELPGLWNGSMADWLTVFMEVPAITFNPVKSVNDLSR